MSVETLESDDIDIGSVFGSAIERREDPELIFDEASYTDVIQRHAQYAYLVHNMPDRVKPDLEETSFFDLDNFVFPFWSHIVVAEDDPESSVIIFERYVAINDMSPQINAKSIEGQVHCEDTQEIGQTLYESTVYDDNGQIIAVLIQDCAVLKAKHSPHIETDNTISPSPPNPLGMKGVGEAGTISALQSVVNASTDALQPFEVDHTAMPLIEEQVWHAVTSEEEGS